MDLVNITDDRRVFFTQRAGVRVAKDKSIPELSNQSCCITHVTNNTANGRAEVLDKQNRCSENLTDCLEHGRK